MSGCALVSSNAGEARTVIARLSEHKVGCIIEVAEPRPLLYSKACDSAADAQLKAPQRFSFKVEDNVVGDDQAFVWSDEFVVDLLARWKEFIARGQCGLGGGLARLRPGRLRQQHRREEDGCSRARGSKESFRKRRLGRESICHRSLPPVEKASQRSHDAPLADRGDRRDHGDHGPSELPSLRPQLSRSYTP